MGETVRLRRVLGVGAIGAAMVAVGGTGCVAENGGEVTGESAGAVSTTSTIQIQDNTGVCVDTGSGSSPGEVVQAWQCNGSNAQSWTYNSANNTLMNKGLCLDVPGSNFANGQNVQLWSCNGTGAQQWLYQQGMFIAVGSMNQNVNAYNHALCLNAGSLANGRRLSLWDCWWGDPNFHFVMPNAGTTIRASPIFVRNAKPISAPAAATHLERPPSVARVMQYALPTSSVVISASGLL